VTDTIYSKKETSIGRIQRAADSGDDRVNILIVDDRPDKLMALERNYLTLKQSPDEMDSSDASLVFVCNLWSRIAAQEF
jgi:hypothetical protein